MTCPTCRPSYVYPFEALGLSRSHEEAGIRRAPCPDCGHLRWPWEYQPPEWPASGLRWAHVDGGVYWSLRSGRARLGMVRACQGGWRATTWKERDCMLRQHDGTLDECARWLVAEVRLRPSSSLR